MTDTSKDNPDRDTNPDPLTGEPGSHPVGTGAGTAGGGLTGAAVGAAIAGPVGAAVGAVVGGVAGAYSGRGVAEAVNPTVEETFWRENHASQEWARDGSAYDLYAPAYRTGYEGVMKYAGRDYEEAETDLAVDYRKHDPSTALPWDRARPAVKAAWQGVSGTITPRDSDSRHSRQSIALWRALLRRGGESSGNRRRERETARCRTASRPFTEADQIHISSLPGSEPILRG